MLYPSGDKPVGEVGVGELSDTTEGEGSLLRPDEHRELALRVLRHGPDILESYPQPSYEARVVLIPEDKRDSVDVTGIGAQSSLGETAQGLTLLRDDASNIESPTRLTHVSTRIIESKRSSISTFITAPSFRSSVATFRTANSGLRSIRGESAISRFKPFSVEELLHRNCIC